MRLFSRVLICISLVGILAACDDASKLSNIEDVPFELLGEQGDAPQEPMEKAVLVINGDGLAAAWEYFQIPGVVPGFDFSERSVLVVVTRDVGRCSQEFKSLGVEANLTLAIEVADCDEGVSGATGLSDDAKSHVFILGIESLDLPLGNLRAHIGDGEVIDVTTVLEEVAVIASTTPAAPTTVFSRPSTTPFVQS